MNAFFLWLEATAPSVWLREAESVFVFPTILVLHAIGMALAVGVNTAMALRLAGVAPGVPMVEMKRFVPVMWLGFWVNTASGLLLLLAYPTKALTNPMFYLKIGLIGAGMWLFLQMSNVMFVEASGPKTFAGARSGIAGHMSDRTLGLVSLACWVGAITAGRLLAYTATRILASW
jgi:hypothetical protein